MPSLVYVLTSVACPLLTSEVLQEVEAINLLNFLKTSYLGNKMDVIDFMRNFGLVRTSSADDQSCTLSSEAKYLAEKELGEDEQTRSLALKQLRQWIASNPNIQRCRNDTNFLLRFLRTKKFSMDDAQQLLEKYLKMRMENPLWFLELDIRESRLDHLIERGFFFALPEKDDFGRRVFFSRAGCLDPNEDTAVDMMRGVMLGLESLIQDEENQVRGFSYVFDLKNVGLSVVTLWSLGEVTKAFHCSEKTIPMRHKQINFVNMPFTLYAVFEFAKALLSGKIKKRFKVHSNITNLCKVIPLRILPKEYGGTVPMKDMIDSYKIELEAVRSEVLSLDQMLWAKQKVKVDKFERMSNPIRSPVKA